MKKKILIGSIVAVAIIVLSSFSSVVGKVSTEDELVELDVEFCGLGQKHTVQLTQQEADEVELLFDEIHEQLNKVETREGTVEIFKEAIVELDKYGLLGRLSVGQAQRLVIGGVQNPRIMKLQNRIYTQYHETFDEDENVLCLIAGLTSETNFAGALFIFWWGVLNFINTYIDVNENLRQMIGILWIAGMMLVGAYNFFFPFILLSDIYLQEGKGIIFTIGLNGIKTWGGILKGNLGAGNMGVSGFTGLKILFDFKDMNKYFYIGTALRIGIDVMD